MKTLSEMTTSEMESLKADVARAIRMSGEAAELIRFEQAIDDELDRRGA